MDRQLQKNTKKVYDAFKKNSFICENTNEKSIKKLYTFCNEHYEELYDYFLILGYMLMRGNSYFYFVKDQAPSNDYMERKLKHIVKLIDYAEFLLVYDSGLNVGSIISSRELALAVGKEISLKDRLLVLNRGMKKSDIDAVEYILKDFVKMVYAEVVNDYNGTFKILASYNYLKEISEKIKITEGE